MNAFSYLSLCTLFAGCSVWAEAAKSSPAFDGDKIQWETRNIRMRPELWMPPPNGVGATSFDRISNEPPAADAPEQEWITHIRKATQVLLKSSEMIPALQLFSDGEIAKSPAHLAFQLDLIEADAALIRQV